VLGGGSLFSGALKTATQANTRRETVSQMTKPH
jgi:hypothetical protein